MDSIDIVVWRICVERILLLLLILRRLLELIIVIVGIMKVKELLIIVGRWVLKVVCKSVLIFEMNKIVWIILDLFVCKVYGMWRFFKFIRELF